MHTKYWVCIKRTTIKFDLNLLILLVLITFWSKGEIVIQYQIIQRRS